MRNVFARMCYYDGRGELKKNVTLEFCLLQSLTQTHLVAVKDEVELADVLEALVQGLHEDCEWVCMREEKSG
jgi:hypothetical protein